MALGPAYKPDAPALKRVSHGSVSKPSGLSSGKWNPQRRPSDTLRRVSRGSVSHPKN